MIRTFSNKVYLVVSELMCHPADPNDDGTATLVFESDRDFQSAQSRYLLRVKVTQVR